MPKISSRIFDALALWRLPLAAFFDRPLIWLLPFYMLGLMLAWHAESPLAWPSLAAGALLSLAAALLSLAPAWRSFAPLPLAPAALALGFGLSALSLSPPSAGSGHLATYVSQTELKAPLILGGYVLEGSLGRPGQNYRLLVEARELIRPGPEGPEENTPVHGRVRLSVGGEAQLRPGDYVRMPVSLRPLVGFHNPGFSDYEKYWGAQGFWVGGFVKSPALISSWPPEDGLSFLRRWRAEIRDFIYSHSSEPAAGLLAAQLAGLRQAVDPVSEEVFRSLGLSHILSVSGLHLSLWYGLCFWLLRKLFKAAGGGRFPAEAPAAALALIPALFYAALVGPSSPVLRSAVMIVFSVTALILMRRGDMWNALAAAAWIILVWEPWRLFSASFQLSFVATAALVEAFSPRPLTEPGQSSGRTRRLPGLSFIKNSVAAAVAGTLGTAPLVVWHFSRLPLAGLAANVIFTAILSFGILAPSLLSLMALPLWPEAAAWVLGTVSQLLNWLLAPMKSLAELLGPGLLLPAPGFVFMIGYYLAGWLALRAPWPAPQRLAAAAALVAAVTLPGLIAGQGEKNVLRLTVLDIGQGLSVHLNMPDGRQVLIDGGGTYNYDPGERLLTPYLLHQGVTRLDVAALTHPDLDHLKGLVSAADNFRAREIWTAPWPSDISENYERLLALAPPSRLTALSELYRGRRFGPAEIKVLWPPPDYQWPASNPREKNWTNNHGLVFQVRWGELSFLITGDIQREVEEILARSLGPRLRSTVLLAPHHGSRNSLSPAFLEAVCPQWVVFSSGRFNAFGLPHPEAVARAAEAGAKIWRTDRQGAAVFEVKSLDGQSVLIAPPF